MIWPYETLFCTTHLDQDPRYRQAHSLPPISKSRAEKVERAVKLAGGVTGLVAGTIKIIEFIATHWPKMQDVLKKTIDGQIRRDGARRALPFPRPTGEINVRNVVMLKARFESELKRLSRTQRRVLEDEFGPAYVRSVRRGLTSIDD